MKRMVAALIGAALMAVLPLTSSQAVPVAYKVAVKAGELKTWQGTAATGVNANYNGHVDQLPSGQCSTTDAQTLCEYTLVSLTNTVPVDDLDGKLRKNVTIILDKFSVPSPASDFAMKVFESDAEGTTKGAEVAFSDNSDVPDPDEAASFPVETTLTTPTKHYLVEVVYFSTVNASYRGVVNFGQAVAKTTTPPAGVDRAYQITPFAAGHWAGGGVVGFNENYFTNLVDEDPTGTGHLDPYTCSKDAQHYCEHVLIEYVNPMTQAEIDAGLLTKRKTASFTIDNWGPPDPVSDLDVILFKSDATGALGDEMGQSAKGANEGSYETVSFAVTTTPTVSSVWVLARIVYFQAPNTTYEGHIVF